MQWLERMRLSLRSTTGYQDISKDAGLNQRWEAAVLGLVGQRGRRMRLWSIVTGVLLLFLLVTRMGTSVSKSTKTSTAQGLHKLQCKTQELTKKIGLYNCHPTRHRIPNSANRSTIPPRPNSSKPQGCQPVQDTCQRIYTQLPYPNAHQLGQRI
jgi:hypothetical protein